MEEKLSKYEYDFLSNALFFYLFAATNFVDTKDELDIQHTISSIMEKCDPHLEKGEL